MRRAVVADGGVIRRKLAALRADLAEGGPGADRGWRVALARAARDHLKLPLEVSSLSLGRAGLAEVLELPAERSLLAVLEGPAGGVGLLAVAPAVLQGMIEMLTMGRVAAAGADSPRKPTRTDAAMVAPWIDAALGDLETALAQEADIVWAGGWRYASYLDDPRPLGLMLEDTAYRVLRAEVDLSRGARQGNLLLILPAEGRGRLPAHVTATPQADDGLLQRAFSDALAEEVQSAECQLTAVLARVALPLSRIADLASGDLMPLPLAALDRISLEGVDGRRLAEGKLGQNRGMRAIKLTALMEGPDKMPMQPASVTAGGPSPPALRQAG